MKKNTKHLNKNKQKKPLLRLEKGKTIEIREIFGGEKKIPFMVPVAMTWRKYMIFVNLTKKDARRFGNLLLDMAKEIERREEEMNNGD